MQNNTYYIGFSGRIGSGKSHISDVLLHRSKNVLPILLPFAKPLKKLAKEYFGWDGQKDDRGRKLLQVLGTEVGREYGGWDFWIRKWKQEIERFKAKQLENLPKNWHDHTFFLVIVDDIRFSNEAEEIISHGGKVFEVVNKEIENNNDHISENGIDPKYITRIIDNTCYSLTEQRIVDIFSEFYPTIYGRK